MVDPVAADQDRVDGHLAGGRLWFCPHRPEHARSNGGCCLSRSLAWRWCVGWLWYAGGSNVISDSSLRILWQLIKGGVASLVLLAGCIMLFRKRAGIVLLHAGILLMMFGELLVGTGATEGHMRIPEGATVNYVEASRDLELAVVDDGDRDAEHVVAVPATHAAAGNDHPRSEFTLRSEGQ